MIQSVTFLTKVTMVMSKGKFSSVSLRVASKVKSCTEISDTLGLTPSKVFEIGDSLRIKSSPEKIREESLWLLDLNLNETLPLEDHLNEIVALLNEKMDGIRHIKMDSDVDLFCCYSSDNGQGGFVLNGVLLNNLGTLGIDVVFDLYMQ